VAGRFFRAMVIESSFGVSALKKVDADG